MTTTPPNDPIYAYSPEFPIMEADRWFWQSGDRWMAVHPGETEEEWFEDLDAEQRWSPRVRVLPIDEAPTDAWLIYRDDEGNECEVPPVQKREPMWGTVEGVTIDGKPGLDEFHIRLVLQWLADSELVLIEDADGTAFGAVLRTCAPLVIGLLEKGLRP